MKDKTMPPTPLMQYPGTVGGVDRPQALPWQEIHRLQKQHQAINIPASFQGAKTKNYYQELKERIERE